MKHKTITCREIGQNAYIIRVPADEDINVINGKLLVFGFEYNYWLVLLE